MQLSRGPWLQRVPVGRAWHSLHRTRVKDILGMGFVDVVVPPGVSAGGVMEFESGGASLTATVPDGLGPGDTFQVPVDGASSSDIMQSFMAWFERESVGDKVDAYVVENAHRMAATGSIEPGGEHSHEWWPLYCEYQTQFESLLKDFLDEAGCTVEQFLAAAKDAEGLNEIYVQLFLAHSEYSMFVELMSMEALKQAAENDVG